MKRKRIKLLASGLRLFFLVVGSGAGCAPVQPPAAKALVLHEEMVYSNSFSGPVGASYPEWTSSPIAYMSEKGGGTLPAPAVTITESPNKKARFLGEFGGPAIGKPGDDFWGKVRVKQSIYLSLHNLKPHRQVSVGFDLYVLKSWDGDSPAYGSDLFSFGLANGPTLFTTSFSNNPKLDTDQSYQAFPSGEAVGSRKPPHTGAVKVGTLGYNDFFKDSIYHLQFTFWSISHDLTLEFSSSLFEGKGTEDESWGLDNVVVMVRSVK